MKDVATMPGRLAAFLNRNESGRTAAVEHYEIMTGGYSRVMARASVRWNDGARETLVLRGDPAPGEAMLETDRDVEWDVLRAITKDRTVPGHIGYPHLATPEKGEALFQVFTRDVLAMLDQPIA